MSEKKRDLRALACLHTELLIQVMEICVQNDTCKTRWKDSCGLHVVLVSKTQVPIHHRHIQKGDWECTLMVERFSLMVKIFMERRKPHGNQDTGEYFLTEKKFVP